MTKVASASINSFPYSAVPTSGSTIISQVLEELRELREEVQELREQVARQNEYIASLESSQNGSHETLALDIAKDRQRLTRLENTPQTMPLAQSKKTKYRVERLRARVMEPI
jgi:hypothetical protein